LLDFFNKNFLKTKAQEKAPRNTKKATAICRILNRFLFWFFSLSRHIKEKRTANFGRVAGYPKYTFCFCQKLATLKTEGRQLFCPLFWLQKSVGESVI